MSRHDHGNFRNARQRLDRAFRRRPHRLHSRSEFGRDLKHEADAAGIDRKRPDQSCRDDILAAGKSDAAKLFDNLFFRYFQIRPRSYARRAAPTRPFPPR